MKVLLDKPFNGGQFIDELKAKDIVLLENLSQEGDVLTIKVAKKDEAETKNIFDAHIAVDKSQERIAARQAILDKLGLTADEVAVLLG
jgi:hypothetical protein